MLARRPVEQASQLLGSRNEIVAIGD